MGKNFRESTRKIKKIKKLKWFSINDLSDSAARFRISLNINDLCTKKTLSPAKGKGREITEGDFFMS